MQSKKKQSTTKQKQLKSKQNITNMHRNKDMKTAKKRFHQRLKSKENNMKNDIEKVVKIKPQIIASNNDHIWNDYISKYQVEPNNPLQLRSFSKTHCNTILSYQQCKIIYDANQQIKANPKTKANKKATFIERDMVAAKKRYSQRKNSKHAISNNNNNNNNHKNESDESDETESNSSDNYTSSDEEITPKKVKVAKITSPKHYDITYSPYKYTKYTKQNTLSSPQTVKYGLNNGKQSPFSSCRQITHHSRPRSDMLMKNKHNKINGHGKTTRSDVLMKNKHNQLNVHKHKRPPLTSYIKNKMKSAQKLSVKKRKHEQNDSTISVLSVLSDLSMVNTMDRKNAKFHSFQQSILSNIEGPFSILPQIIQDYELEQQSELPELIIDEQNAQQIEQSQDEEKENDNIDHELIVDVPINPATEIFGNFLGALAGACVPALDIVSSIDAAEQYEMLRQYAENIDGSGNAHTLLLYEQLDGVSLFDLKQQLQVAEVSLTYTKKSTVTTQQRIQRYFVSVVRKTFGMELPNHFSDNGISMIRDAGFLFAVDMFLFNVSRFPVLIPFEGKTNAKNLFISTDEDGYSVLYGLCNRFMGGHDIIDMPNYLINATNNNSSINHSNESHKSMQILLLKQRMQLLLTKQRMYTNEYIQRLEKFLFVLSDYYQKKIFPIADTQNMNKNNDNINKLIHGLPLDKDIQNIVSNHGRNKQITHTDCIEFCLRPIANYLYIHCGLELIIIDEYNSKNENKNNNMNDEAILKTLELYRNKLIDNMITLICEGILIGISQISEQIQANDIDEIINDIKSLNKEMLGIELISSQFINVVLKLFHSTSATFELNIEDYSSDESSDEDH